MKKLIKVIIWLLAILIALYVAALITFKLIVKPEDIKRWINQGFYKATGRHLVIKGSINLSLFPWLGAKVGKITIDNPENFTAHSHANYFANIGQVNVKIKLLPLISGHIVAKTLTLKNTTINLINNQAGQTNWQFSRAKKTNTNQNKKENNKKPFSLKIIFPNVNISNANLNYYNEKKSEQMHLKHFYFKSASFKPGQNTSFNAGFDYQQNKPAVDLSVKVSSDAFIDFKQQSFKLNNVNLQSSIKQLGSPKPFNQAVNFIVKSNVALNLKEQTFNLNRFAIKLANLAANGVLVVNHFNNNPSIQGKLHIPTFSLRALLARLQLAYQPIGNDALQQVSFDTQFSANADNIKTSQLVLSIDKTKLQGAVNFVKKAIPVLSFNLQGNQLQADSYLPKANKQQQPSSQASVSSQTDANATIIPVEVLRKVNWQGNVKLQSLTYHHVILNNVNVVTYDRNQQVGVTPVTANLQNGRIEAKLIANIQTNAPTIQASLATNNVPLGPVVNLFSDKKFMQGTINLSANINMQGNSENAWKKSLNGTAKVDVKNGKIKGLDLNQLIASGLAIIKKQPLPTTNNKNETTFSSLTGTANITNGLISNNDLAIKAYQLQATGSGQINLLTNSVDYRIAAGYGVNAKWQIPILIRGQLTKPKIGPDMEKLATMMIKNTVKDKIQKGLQDVLGKDFDLKKLIP